MYDAPDISDHEEPPHRVCEGQTYEVKAGGCPMRDRHCGIPCRIMHSYGTAGLEHEDSQPLDSDTFGFCK